MTTSVGLQSHQMSLVLVNRSAPPVTAWKDRVEQELGQPVINVITPASDLVHQSTRRRDPVVTAYPDATVATQFLATAQHLAQL
jgi:nitrogenase subunit NifH